MSLTHDLKGLATPCLILLVWTIAYLVCAIFMLAVASVFALVGTYAGLGTVFWWIGALVGVATVITVVVKRGP